ncbi:hypothetical protein [Pararobbsia silviterrae]|uniref:Uncharacterized protein n=1 Tax=Pararobbsia silviterrae TaxID=1792498 RepID=A0A494Y2G0_9BURK|nr:hypothetical protein [Pararobbsia silviterrae]RKP54522.1 hypothetical protein D7S86_12600 [Pararobbsia silviterrae]
MTSYFPQWVQDLNTALSLFGVAITTAGFVLTLYVTYQVSHIRKHYLARGRLPDVIKDIEKIGSTLSAHLDDWPKNERDFAGQLQLANPLLMTASKMVKRADGLEARRLAQRLAKSKKSSQGSKTIDEAWALYYEMQKTVIALKQVEKNMNWE